MGEDPVLSVGIGANYQSLALKNAFGSLTDQKLLAPDLYLNLPVTEQAELVSEVTRQSAYGPSSITAAGTGYVPTALDPLVASGARRVFTNSLANRAFRSFLVHWNAVF
jgi:hypothetical protein